MNRRPWLVVAMAVAAGSACGSAAEIPRVTIEGPNVVPLVVNSGPQGNYTNGLFASVTVCEPGTAQCQQIDHVLVDTGSVGLRILESALRLNLPPVTTATGDPMAECTSFVDGAAWGPVRLADVQLGGETVANLPIQAIGEATFPLPSRCTGYPITDLDSLATYGILGVGVFLEDCGEACASTGGNPGMYYGCSPTGTCSVVAAPLEKQVPHPVAALPVDNNGVMIHLPALPERGAESAEGAMVLGIGTQANNQLADAVPLVANFRGHVNTEFPAGSTKPYTSVFDTGSNGLFFLDAETSGISQCALVRVKDFYCPPGLQSLTATVSDWNNGVSATVAFAVVNAASLNGRASAFSNLAGPMPGFPGDESFPAFDWGLPFFFGRRVFTTIETRVTPGGVGPFYAF